MTHPLSHLEPGYANRFGTGVRSVDADTLEWPITDLKGLVEHVEQNAAGVWGIEIEMANPEKLPDALSNGWMTWSQTYKIDLARTIPAPHSPRSTIDEIVSTTPSTPVMGRTLSLYIMAQDTQTCPIDDCCTPTGIFVGIAPLHPNAGHRYAETRYHWTRTTTFDFSEDNEYCAVELPFLSTIAKKGTIKEDDGFKLCIWIGPKWDARPSFTVPDPRKSSTLRGLERLVDRDTGDIMFVCLEHIVQSAPPEAITENGVEEDKIMQRQNPTGQDEELPENMTGLSFGFVTGSPITPGPDHTIAWTPTPRPDIASRKRFIYAHSDILEEKSEYFKDLLTSGFMETYNKRNTITVHDGDFNTLYWVIRYLYTDSITFAAHTPVRATVVVQQLSCGEKNKLLLSLPPYMGPKEWDLHTLAFEGEEEEEVEFKPNEEIKGDNRNVKTPSGDCTVTNATRQQAVEGSRKISNSENKDISNLRTRSAASRTSNYSDTSAPRRVPVSGRSGKAASESGTVSYSRSTPSKAVRAVGGGGSSHVANTPKDQSFKSPRKVTSPHPLPNAKLPSTTIGTAASTSPAFMDLSSKNTHNRDTDGDSTTAVTASTDPHPHPTPCPPDANALEVYFLANQYRLEALKAMAQEHLLGNIKVDDCMPMAFATYRFDDLHSEILSYIAFHWYEVKETQAFLRCVQEVREDVWGETGPLVLHNLFMRL
ncbi:hypothetical protein IAU59_003628 [Kwoniella sp. CBS 9459]